MLSTITIIKYFSISWFVIYSTLVLFGSPLLNDILETVALTTFITLVTVLPILRIVPSENHLVDIISNFPDTSETSPAEITRILVAIFAVLGLWISSALYPLDWDRWYQRYPIPGFFGTFVGALVGLAAGTFNKYTGRLFPDSSKSTKKQCLIIPKTELFLHSIKICLKNQMKILGYPVGLDHINYGRGRYTFNMCFVVAWDSNADSMYEPIVQKCAEYLIELEQEYNFLTNNIYQDQVVKLINFMFDGLNSKGESVVGLQIDDQNIMLYFKLCPSYRGIEPPEVNAYMVPMFIRDININNRIIEKMDVLSQKIIPRIDGIATVREISNLLQLDVSLVARCVRNLHFYECVSLVPMFLYSNTYVATERVHDFYMNQTEITDCLEFVKIQDSSLPLPEFSDVFRLYLSMKCGRKLLDWVKEEKPRQMRIDEHRFVQFGMHHQFLRKLTIYPICLIPPQEKTPKNKLLCSCNGKTSLEELAFENNLDPDKLYDLLEESKKFEFVMK
ncbi:unnamed protein product [Caenorhabditis angaria]|uniref:Nitrogen permease regulator 2-like protein n=1 Tax=Caenorhabditis angaria TaxID=860376 RepID=A0A9P1N3F1_9PELO|nr:unnamed protein product [Caenorhabditis angaria]